MLSSCYIGVGAGAVLVTVWVGEITGPIHTVFLATRSLKDQVPWAAKVFYAVAPPYTFYYVFVRRVVTSDTGWVGTKPLHRPANPIDSSCRSVLGPPAMIWVVYHVVQSPLLPLPIKALWSGLILLATAGSQVWSKMLVQGYLKSRAKRAAAQKEGPEHKKRA